MVNITSQVCNEVYDIIYHMEEELFNKIPKGFINIIKQNRDESCVLNIDYSKSINDQELQKETRIILSLIYRDYLCSEEERKNIIEQDKEELREKYNPDNIFKNKREIKNEEQVEEKSLTVVHEEKWYRKIFNLIKGLFGKK